MSRYQIIRKSHDKGTSWTFVAHGARYTKDEAHEMRRHIENNSGDMVRLLPC